MTKWIIFSLHQNHPCHFLCELKIEKAAGKCGRGLCSWTEINKSKTQPELKSEGEVRWQGQLGSGRIWWEGHEIGVQSESCRIRLSTLPKCPLTWANLSPTKFSRTLMLMPSTSHIPNSDVCVLTWQNQRPGDHTRGIHEGSNCTPNSGLSLPVFGCLRETGAKLSLHVTWTDVEPWREQTAMTLKRPQAWPPHKVILMKSLFRMTYRWRSRWRQAAEERSEQMVLLVHQSCSPFTIEPWLHLPGQRWQALKFLVPHHLLAPQKELCFGTERKTNEHLQLLKPGRSLNSKFQESSRKGGTMICLWGLNSSNVYGVVIISHYHHVSLLHNT